MIKTNLDINNIYFISNGNIVNKKDKLENIMSELDKRNKRIKILVYSINSTINIENTNIKKSKDIICPKYKEICLYEIKDYKIKLYDCKNRHINEYINLNEYENKQKIDNICDQPEISSIEDKFVQMSLDLNKKLSDSNNSNAEVRNINNNEQKNSINNNGNKNSANNIFVRDKFILEEQPSDYLLFKNFNDTDMKPE